MSHQRKSTTIEPNANVRQGVVFQLWRDDTGVFFSKEIYARYRVIEIALSTAKTWRNFEQLLPDSEFERLDLWWDNDGEHVYRDGDRYRFIDAQDIEKFQRVCRDERVIRGSDKFQPSLLGLEEGDYPPWLANTADEILPPAFVDDFGTRVGGMTSGTWTEYPLVDLMEMVETLGLEGFSVMAHLSNDFGCWRQIDLAS